MFNQSTGYLITAAGLVSDIVGALLLFRFGLPEIQRTGGEQFISTGGKDQSAVKLEKRHDFWGKVGVILLVLGFLGQLVPTLNSWFTK